MHVGAILQETTIDRLDKDVFLASILKKDRSWLFAHNEAILSDVQVEQVFEYIKRREAGEPVAYILGEKEFYGRNFSVNEHTLIPRPSTEGLIEMVLKNEKYKKLDTEVIGVFVSFNKPSPLIPLPRGEGSLIVDIGTGSGCIAITLAKEIPNIKIIATDISKDALDIAKENAKLHNVEIDFREGDVLDPIKDIEEPFWIVSNPPYLSNPNTEHRTPNHYEPLTALYAGPNGTDVLQKLVTQAKKHPFCLGLFLECREDQYDREALKNP